MLSYRYATIDQKKAVVRFKITQPKIYEQYKIGSSEWYQMNISELENMELKE